MKDLTNKQEKGIDQGYTVEKYVENETEDMMPMMDSEDTNGGFVERNNYYDRL